MARLTRRDLCRLALGGAAAGALGLRRSAAAERPNLVLLYADDLGYGDLSCYGGQLVPTPRLDRLAAEGVRCTDGYVTAPVCAPSRCGLLAGAYNQRFGMQWNEDRPRYRFGEHQLLPQALRAAGYVTGHLGKWNVPAAVEECFDEAHAVMDWEGDYFPDATGHYYGVDRPDEHASRKVQGVWGPERAGEEYLTDRLGRQAVEFITRHRARPFFLYLAFNAVHSPWHGKASDRERFAAIAEEPLRYYASMVSSLDENVGRVLDALRELGLERNTLVMFASDNGPANGGAQIKGWPEAWPKRLLMGSAGPLNGWKAQFFEGGIREPFLLRWPDRLPAGAVYRQPVSTMDLYPTCCAAASAPVPAATRLDGVDLLPFLRGEQTAAPHDLLFWKSGDQGAVRQGDWKLVLTTWGPKQHLFNLASDLGEQQNLATQQPERCEQLHRAWLDWSATLPPRANPPRPAGQTGGRAQ